MNSNYKKLHDLHGIKIAYENDFYDLAKLVLNIMDATDKNRRTRPTINGLAKKYSWICGDKISSDQIIDIVKKSGLHGNDVIDFDHKKMSS